MAGPGGYGGPPPGAPPGGYGGPPPGAPPGGGGYGGPPGAPPGGGGYGGPPPGAPPGGYGGPPPGAPPGGGYGAPPGAPGGYGAPPGQPGGYGQPPPGQPGGYGQPPPQGPQGPSFGGIGLSPGGRVNVNVGMGGFHPNAIARALISGEGFDSPRKFGAMAAALGFGILIIESILIYVVHIWFPWFYVIAFPLFWGGVWMLILGQPKKSMDGTPAPMWGRIVVGVVMVLGLLQGLGFAFMG